MASGLGLLSGEYKKLPYVEPLEKYRQGGFHPIHLGDKLNSDRYFVLNKLGHGVDSTVWLAHDTRDDKAVAVSVLMSEISGAAAQNRFAIQHRLACGDSSHPGHTTMLIPTDNFEINGPNGKHLCLVTPVMGPSIGAATKRGQGAAARGLPLLMAKLAVLDLANGIAYMSSQGVVHGGMIYDNSTIPLIFESYLLTIEYRSSPFNILLEFIDKVIHDYRSIADFCGLPRTTPVVRIDGQSVPENMPKYCVESAFQKEFEPSLFSGHIKISDFGDSFLVTSPPQKLLDWGPFMVPEFASPSHRTPAIDVWMFGAALFQIISGHDLFGIVNDPTKLVLKGFMDTLGRPPPFLLEDWKNFLNEDLSVVETPHRSLSTRIFEIKDGSAVLGMMARHDEFSLEDIKALTRLLGLLLRYAPAERAQINEVLQSSDMAFFKEPKFGM